MIDTIKKLFFVSRPISWVNTAYPFAAGYIVSGGALSVSFFVSTLFFLIPYNLLMYGINDVFDYESDIRNPRKGGIEGMKEQRAFHPTIVWAALVSTIPFVAYMMVTGTVTSAVVLIALVFFVVAYSVAGLRFKERPFLDSITSSIHFVGPLVYALVLVQTSPAMAWPFVVAFFLWGMASHAFGAVQDIIPDRQGKLASVATFLGTRKTIVMCVILYVVASLLVALQGWPAWLIAIPGLAYVVNVALYIKLDDANSGKANKGWRRFIWLNLLSGFVVTIVLIIQSIY
jgi:4-hydroxybenzoate polyprenyltransferase